MTDDDRRSARPHPLVPAAAAVLAAAALMAAAPHPIGLAQESTCAGTHFVASWTASPTDSVTPIDATGGIVPSVVGDQTFRMVVTPHLSGPHLRIRLTNRFGVTPVTFARVSVGEQAAGATLTGAPAPVRFGGADSITLAPGAEITSDPVPWAATAFAPLAVSLHVTGSAGPPTKHWNANATSYYSAIGSGDLTGQTGEGGFDHTTHAWLYVSAVDVAAPAGTRAVVAFGDSITDGFVGATPLSVPADRAVADTDHRYPDRLQHRLDAAGVPISVVNAGIGSNRVVTSGEPLMLGPSGVARFERDALDQAGVAGVLVQEGINDLGLPPTADAAAIVAGYEQLIDAAHRHGKKIWLGTLLPAADALVDGVATAPRSEADRQAINAWIRGQNRADGVVDFDVALRDPANPSVLRAEYASPDRLHPNPRGYQAMAEAVDLALLAETRSPAC